MRLFGRWRKNSNNDRNIPTSELGGNKKRYSKPAIGQEHRLFDGIIGYDDVKELFDIYKGRKACTSTSGGTTCVSQIIVYEFTY
jgi:hypothetical protein